MENKQTRFGFLMILMLVAFMPMSLAFTLNPDDGYNIETDEVISPQFTGTNDFHYTGFEMENNFAGDYFYGYDQATCPVWSGGDFSIDLDGYSSFCYHDGDTGTDHKFTIDFWDYFDHVELTGTGGAPPFNGTGWNRNDTSVNGLSGLYNTQHGGYTLFNGDAGMTLIDFDGSSIDGYVYNGVDWSVDNSVVNGIVDFGTSIQQGDIAMIGDDLVLIHSYWTGNLESRVWNGSSWELNSTYISGVTGGANRHFRFFDLNGTMKLIKMNDATFQFEAGYSWNGATWVNDATVIAGITPFGERPDIDIYYNDGYKAIVTYSGDGPSHRYKGYSWNVTQWSVDYRVDYGFEYAITGNSGDPQLQFDDFDGTLKGIVIPTTGVGPDVLGWDWNGTYVPFPEEIPQENPVVFDNFTGTDFTQEANTSSVDMPIISSVTSTFTIAWAGVDLDFANADLDTFITPILNGVSVESSSLPSGINSSANVSITNIQDIGTPQVLVNGVPCTECTLVSFNGTDALVTVPHFSNITIGNVTCNFECIGYDTPLCLLNDTSTAGCNLVNETEACGIPFNETNMTFSDFTNITGVCDYCTPDPAITCAVEDTSSCAVTNFTGNVTCASAIDNNGCFAQTSLPSDELDLDALYPPYSCSIYTNEQFNGAQILLLALLPLLLILVMLFRNESVRNAFSEQSQNSSFRMITGAVALIIIVVILGLLL